MRLEKDRYGEDVVLYDSPSEMVAAIRSYLAGNLAALTCEEVSQLRACVEDPNGIRWEAEHAGMLAEEVDVLDFNGLVFILGLGRTFEEGREILLRKIGPSPVTNLALWEIEREMTEPQAASPHVACDRFKMSSPRAVGPATFLNRSRSVRCAVSAVTTQNCGRADLSPEAKRREATTNLVGRNSACDEVACG